MIELYNHGLQTATAPKPPKSSLANRFRVTIAVTFRYPLGDGLGDELASRIERFGRGGQRGAATSRSGVKRDRPRSR